MRVYESSAMNIDKIGCPGGEAYLVRTPERTLLYDSGFAYSAPAMVAELAELLGEQPLDYLFLSHSHYDHASGSVWVKQRWPHVAVFGGAHAAHVLERPGARATMRTLNEEAAKEAVAAARLTPEQAAEVDYSLLDNLGVDEAVGQGSVIDMGSVKLEVIEAPGHTRCSLLLWCPEESLLFGSETLGVMINENMVCPACLTGYYDSLAAIAKAQALNPQHILVSHLHIASNEAAKRYLDNAQHWTEKTAHLVWECNAVGMSKSKIEGMIKEIFFIEELRGIQPEAAFDLNNGYLVDQLLSCAAGSE